MAATKVRRLIGSTAQFGIIELDAFTFMNVRNGRNRGSAARKYCFTNTVWDESRSGSFSS